MERKIPLVMATQHPDNARHPYWQENSFINTIEEVEECYRTYKDLGCDEYMWDWEGKFVDEAIIDKLFRDYLDFFNQNQLGRDCFLTFRIPNIWQERAYRIARCFMGILTAQDLAKELNFYEMPVFELILPMTDSAKKLIYIQKTFRKTFELKQKVFRGKKSPSHFGYIEMIPLIEGVDILAKGGKILHDYLALHKDEFGFTLKYIRPFIARSDPALNSGLVPAVLAAKLALSKYYKFEKETGVKIYPIIGAGSLPFRGGLTPLRVSEFVKEYPGIRTVTIQSSFRYDFNFKDVIKGIIKLKQILPETKPKILSIEEEVKINVVSKIFSQYYRQTIEKIAEPINEIASFVPPRRERVLHIGLFGYPRGIGKKKLPRAIPFTAALYSLGIPPELIGTGRGLRQARKEGLLGILEKNYLYLKEDLKTAGNYLNKENLSLLARINPAWKAIQKDVRFIEEYLGESLGPRTAEEYIHRNHASNIFFLWRENKDLQEDIVKTALIRKSLG